MEHPKPFKRRPRLGAGITRGGGDSYGSEKWQDEIFLRQNPPGRFSAAAPIERPAASKGRAIHPNGGRGNVHRPRGYLKPPSPTPSVAPLGTADMGPPRETRSKAAYERLRLVRGFPRGPEVIGESDGGPLGASRCFSAKNLEEIPVVENQAGISDNYARQIGTSF